MEVTQSLVKMPPPNRLPTHDIEWYLVNIENQNYIDLWNAINSLSSDEDIRRNSFKYKHLNHSFALRRGLLRFLLAKKIKSVPKKVPINYRNYGKPFISGNKVYFNLSASNNYTIYAFSSSQELGVDIESVIKMPDEPATAEHLMANDEYSVYQSLSPKSATEFFFNCWTAKEAYLKLLGVGLTIEPKQVYLQFKGLEPIKAEAESSPQAELIYLNLLKKAPLLGCVAIHPKEKHL